MKLSSFLYRAARISRNIEAVDKTLETGNPKYAAHRAKNVAVGRTLRKLGFWRWLWR